MKMIRELKQGDFFTLKKYPYPKENQVYIREEYDKNEKKYRCRKFDDISESRLFKGDKQVFTDFIF